MGKSVDLPDPLESVASQPLGNADDLLAQLAGEEVDRLLAEADAEGRQQPKPGEARRAADVPADLAAAVTAPPPEAAVQDQLDALFSEITTESPTSELPADFEPPADAAPTAAAKREPVAPIAPVPFSPITSELPDDIDANEVMAAILGDVGSITPAPMALPPVEPQAILTTPAPAPTPASSGAIVPARFAELETSPAERQGLAVPNPADELPGPGELELLSAPVEDDMPLPAYLKPLEWINAPLDMLPSTFRDVLGQIAILTLVNAIAVLIYVFVFRSS